MQTVQSNGCTLHVQVDGPVDAPVLMLANSLGTDLRVWDPMLAEMSADLRVVRFDKRGHGLSDCPDAPYAIDTLVQDAIAVADAFEVRGATFVGLSIGGLIGQGLCLARPDIAKRLVLMDTAAKIGTQDMWDDRIAALRSGGLASIAEGILDRWFAPGFRNDPVRLPPWRHMLSRTPVEGYIGCCQAIAGADFTDQLSDLALPVMAMAGTEDMSTPPELVKATADLLNAEFHAIENAGHLPCIEQPKITAELITRFMEETNNV